MEMPPPLLSELLAISAYAGRSRLLVQAGGGNGSVKSRDGELLWIKASGVRMADVRAGHGIVGTKLATVRKVIHAAGLSRMPRGEAHQACVNGLQRAVCSGAPLRPSLETGLHAELGPVVLHTHPVYVNAFGCMSDGREQLAETLHSETTWVDYSPPGWELASKVCEVAGSGAKRGAAIVLANHGFIASAESADGAIALTERYVTAGQQCFGVIPPEWMETAPNAGLAHWAEAFARASSVRWPSGRLCVRPAGENIFCLAAQEPSRWWGGPLVPDDVVYVADRLWVVPSVVSAARWLDTNLENLPEKMAIAVTGLGVLCVARNEQLVAAMQETLMAHLLIRLLVSRRGAVRELPPREVAYLSSMESERYRREIAAAGGV